MRKSSLNNKAPETPTEVFLDRYPGIRCFERNEAHLFFGREFEKLDVYNRVLQERHLIIFAKSGIGKSSLINAGLIPQLEENDYFPIRIRFQFERDTQNLQKQNNPLDFVKEPIKNYYKPDNVLEYDDNQHLWEYIKASNIPFGLTPVFIFDQFEEFFNFPSDLRNEFIEDISEILYDTIPTRIYNWIQSVPMDERTEGMLNWAKQPDLKVVFALRSDRLYLMYEMAKYFPNIRKNEFVLLPLSLEKAKDGLEKPAQLAGRFSTEKFSFEPNFINKVIDYLSKGNDYIESTFLQIVCNQIEEKVKEKQASGESKVIVDESFFGGEEELKKYLDDLLKIFYRETISKIQIEDIKSDKLQNFIRKIIEDELISFDKRDSFSENKFKEKVEQDKIFNLNKKGSFVKRTLFGNILEKISTEDNEDLNKIAHQITNNLLEQLKNSRIIREENGNLGKTFELSHDCLVEPVSIIANERRILEKQKVEKFRIVLGISVITSLFFVSFWLYNLWTDSQELSIKFKKMYGEVNKGRGDDYKEKRKYFLAFRLYEEARKNGVEGLDSLINNDLFTFSGEKILIDTAKKLAYILDDEDFLTICNFKNRPISFRDTIKINGEDSNKIDKFNNFWLSPDKNTVATNTDSMIYIFKDKVLFQQISRNKKRGDRIYNINFSQNSKIMIIEYESVSDSYIKNGKEYKLYTDFPIDVIATKDEKNLLYIKSKSQKDVFNKAYDVLIKNIETGITKKIFSNISLSRFGNLSKNGLVFKEKNNIITFDFINNKITRTKIRVEKNEKFEKIGKIIAKYNIINDISNAILYSMEGNQIMKFDTIDSQKYLFENDKFLLYKSLKTHKWHLFDFENKKNIVLKYDFDDFKSGQPIAVFGDSIITYLTKNRIKTLNLKTNFLIDSSYIYEDFDFVNLSNSPEYLLFNNTLKIFNRKKENIWVHLNKVFPQLTKEEKKKFGIEN